MTGLTTAYLGTIVLANWLITVFGVVAVGFGLQAPGGRLTPLVWRSPCAISSMTGWARVGPSA